MSESDLIDLYLDRLVECLDGPGGEIRRALAEAEDHLRQAQIDGIESGMSAEAAAAVALARFGEPEEVSRRYGLMRALASPGQILAQVVLSLTLVGAFVLIAIGLSGALAAAGSTVFGPEFISGDGPGVTYSAERCQDFLGFFPDAGSCEAAAVLHHLDETIGFRVDAGILGLLVLAGWWLLRTTIGRMAGPSLIPAVFVPVASTALFAAAAVLLGGMGTVGLVFGGPDSGAGSNLTAGVVSLAAAAGFGAWLIRELRSGAG